MTKSEMVRAYVSEHPYPIQEHCYKVELRWKGNDHKKGGEYTNVYSPANGKHIYVNKLLGCYRHIESQEYFITEPKKNTMLQCTYAKYIPEYEMIDLGRIYMSIDRPDELKNKDQRIWEFGGDEYDRCGKLITTHRLFMFRHDINAYMPNGEIYMPDEMGRYYNKGVLNFLTNILTASYNVYDNWKNIDEFRMFVQNNTKEPSSWKESVDRPWGFARYYKTITPRSVSKEAIARGDIANATLRDINTLPDTPVFITREPDGWHGSKEHSTTSFYLFLDKQGDNFIIQLGRRTNFLDGNAPVLNDGINKMTIGETRSVISHGSFDGYPDRIVVDAKGNVSSYRYDTRSKKYEKTSHIMDVAGIYYREKWTFYEKDDWEALPGYKEAKALFTDGFTHDYANLKVFITMVRFPRLRELFNNGYVNIVKALIFSGGDSIQAVINTMLGVAKNSVKAVYEEYLGLTKEQLKILDEYYTVEKDTKYNCDCYKYPGVQHLMDGIRHCLGEDGTYVKDLRTIPIADFKLITDYLVPKLSTWRWYQDYTVSVYSWGGKIADNIYADVAKMAKLEKTDLTTYKLILDSIKLNNGLGWDNRSTTSVFSYVKDQETAKRYYGAMLTASKINEAGGKVDWSALLS